MPQFRCLTYLEIREAIDAVAQVDEWEWTLQNGTPVSVTTTRDGVCTRRRV